MTEADPSFEMSHILTKSNMKQKPECMGHLGDCFTQYHKKTNVCNAGLLCYVRGKNLFLTFRLISPFESLVYCNWKILSNPETLLNSVWKSNTKTRAWF
jgi:hypothetical protein